MENKIKSLETAMELKTKHDGKEFTCFSDSAPLKLRDIFLDNYEVRDINYLIFSKACDAIAEAWNYYTEKNPTLLEEYIQDNYNEFASVYNSDRLEYLDGHNDSEVMEIARNYSCDTVSEACAIWFNEQVSGAISLILNQYVLKD